MECKVVEVRDRGTFVPMLAIKMGANTDQERWLLARAGFGRTVGEQDEYVLLAKINGGEPCKAHIDPYSWGQNPRTYFEAHRYIAEHWDQVQPGGVVCVEYALGERLEPKKTERLGMELGF